MSLWFIHRFHKDHHRNTEEKQMLLERVKLVVLVVAEND